MSRLPEGLVAIGIVRSSRTTLADTPVQSALNPDEVATVEIDEAYVDGLDGLAGFDHAWLLTWLGESHDTQARAPLRQVPYLLQGERREIGIFATRGPRRLNPIGLSLVRVVEISGAQVRFRGVDLLDGTVVIDLKPYVTAFDGPGGTPRCGWFDEVALPRGATPATLDPTQRPGPTSAQR